jgi:hypothetical protein
MILRIQDQKKECESRLTLSLNKSMISHIALNIGLISIISILMRNLFAPGLIEFGDLSYSLTLNSWRSWISLWDPITQSNNLQNIQLLPIEAPLIGLYQILGRGTDALEKTIIFGSLYLSSITMYVASFTLSKEQFGNKYAATVTATSASLFYSLNPWVLAAIEEDSWMISYALIPILFLFFDRSVRSKEKFKFAVLFALVSAIGLNQQFLAIFFMLAIFWTMFLAIKRGRQGFSRIIYGALLSICLFLLFDSYFLLPYLFGSSSINGLISQSASISYALNSFDRVGMINIIHLGGRLCCPSNAIDLFSVQTASSASLAFQLSSLTMPILFVGSFLTAKRSVMITYLHASSLILLFLASGTEGIFSGVFSWVITNFPLFGAFRESYILAGGAAFPYSLICAVAIGALFEKVRSHRRISSNFKFVNNKSFVCVTCVLCIYFLSMYPVASVYSTTYWNPNPPPNSYANAISWLNEQGDNFSVMWIGQHYGSQTFWGKGHPIGPFEVKSTLQPSVYYSSSAPAAPDSANYYYFVLYVLENHLTQNLGKILSPLDIRYVIFTNDTVSNAFPNLNYSLIFGALSEQTDMVLVYHSSFVFIFQNREPIETISSSQDISIIAGGYDALGFLSNDLSFHSESPEVMIDQELFGATFSYLLNKSTSIFLAPEDNQWNLLVQLLNKNDFISGSDFITNSTCWSSGSTESVGGWHSNFPANGLDSFDFDYGVGALWTSCAGATAHISLKNIQTSQYMVVLRHFVQSDGENSSLQVSFPTNSVILKSTNQSYSGFTWTNLGIFNLTSGSAITIESQHGFNALNAIEIIPLREYASATAKLENSLQNKIIFKLTQVGANYNYEVSNTTENNFAPSNFLPSTGPINYFSNGQVDILATSYYKLNLPITFFAWVSLKDNDNASQPNILSYITSFNGTGFFYDNAISKFGFQISLSSFESGRAIETNTVKDSAWHFLTAVDNGTTLELYLDGYLSTTVDLGQHVILNSSTFIIGQDGVGRYFQGYILEAGILNEALNQTQVYGMFLGENLSTLVSGGHLVVAWSNGLANGTIASSISYPKIVKAYGLTNSFDFPRTFSNQYLLDVFLQNSPLSEKTKETRLSPSAEVISYHPFSEVIQTSLIFNPYWVFVEDDSICSPIHGYGIVMYYLTGNCDPSSSSGELSFVLTQYFLTGEIISIVSAAASILIIYFRFRRL